MSLQSTQEPAALTTVPRICPCDTPWQHWRGSLLCPSQRAAPCPTPRCGILSRYQKYPPFLLKQTIYQPVKSLWFINLWKGKLKSQSTNLQIQKLETYQTTKKVPKSYWAFLNRKTEKENPWEFQIYIWEFNIFPYWGTGSSGKIMKCNQVAMFNLRTWKKAKPNKTTNTFSVSNTYKSRDLYLYGYLLIDSYFKKLQKIPTCR